ncbi:MAG: TrbI/VirB10 family protein, partial [Pseudomonadota bacterium]
MMEYREREEETIQEPVFEERGIPEVAAPHRHRSWLGVGFGLAAVLGALWWINGSEETEAPELTDSEPIPFEIGNRSEPPALPERIEPPKPQPRKQPDIDPYQRELEFEVMRQQLKAVEAAEKLAEQRRRAPILIFNKSNNGLAPGQNVFDKPLEVAESVAAEKTIESASRLSNLDRLITQGTLIRGVLETAISSDLAGLVRAQVAHDVYGFDGSRLLIPKGARL